MKHYQLKGSIEASGVDRDQAAVDQRILSAVAEGAVFAFSISGGKDSTVATWAAMKLLDSLGHPRERRIAIHADLGRAEWKSTPAMVEAIAQAFGLELLVVRHRTHDMVSRWEARGQRGRQRYAELEVFNLIGPWSSSSLRFCTAELKEQVISRALQQRFPGQHIVSVIGVRREESLKRQATPISKASPRWDQANGTRLTNWNPAVEFTTRQVFALHEREGLPLHDAYRVWLSSRVSCAFCVLQSKGDQQAATKAPDNRNLFIHLVGIEAWSTFSFQPTRWLADTAPELLPESLRAAVDVAKRKALERRQLEADLPTDLRYVQGWPMRAPTQSEAVQVAAARSAILGHHGLPNLYLSPKAIIDRFDELLAIKAARGRSAELVRESGRTRKIR